MPIYSTFKQFLSESVNKLKNKSKAITYLEDLDVTDFINLIKNISKQIISEKLDGTALTFGFDDEGEFYTTRSGKGSQDTMFYKASDWYISAASNGFKAAHAALKKQQDIIKEFVKPGMAVDIEILFGRQPNTIIYGLDGVNYIAFIKMTDGTNKSLTLDQKIIPKLSKALKKVTSSVRTMIVDTTDGINLTETITPTEWKFTSPEFIDNNHFEDPSIKEELIKLEDFLKQKNKKGSSLSGEDITNFETMSMSLTKISTEDRQAFKILRDKLNDKIMNDFKLPIKNRLLDKYVEHAKPKLQDNKTKDEEQQGLEGLVILDPETQQQVKVVNKDLFSTMNKFNYMIRNNIRGMVKDDAEESSLEDQGGLFGKAKIKIINLFDIDDLAKAYDTKKILNKFKGATPEETVKNFAKSVSALDWRAIKTKIDAVIKSALKDLSKALDNFKENKDTYSIDVKGKKIGYSPEVTRRTLLVFAETRNTLIDLRNKVNKADDIEDIIMACFGKQLKDLHETSIDQ